ncbi:protein kinase [Spirillospora sp. NPDC052269]
MPLPLRAGDPGRLGPYRLTARLGQGGMGTVLLGEDASGRHVAVKVVNPGLAEDEVFRTRFRREVTAARRVSRFCTAPVLDAELEHDPLYVVTEFVDGPTLAAAVRDRGPLRGGDLEGLAVGVATALSAIHAAGIVHRDLKPSNVLLSATGPRVIDFGIARPLTAADGPTVTGQFLGTPAYIAPELMRDGPLTPAADVFAWGCVVAYAATGRPPFAGANIPETLYRVVHEPPVLDGLDSTLHPLVEAALDKDPERRPAVPDLLATLISAPPTWEDPTPTAAPAPETAIAPTSRTATAPAARTVVAPEPPVAASPPVTAASAPSPVAESLARTRKSPPVASADQEETSARQGEAGAGRGKAGRDPRRGRRFAAGALVAALLLGLGSAAGWRLLSDSPDPEMSVPKLGAALVPDGSLNDPATGWDVECGVYGNGRLKIEGDKESAVYCTAPGEVSASHFVAQARVRLDRVPSGTLWGAGLLLLGTDDRDYAVMLRSDGSARLVKETANGNVKVLDTVPAGTYKPTTNYVRVQAEVHVTPERTSVRAWLDGEYALDADDETAPFAKGRTSLFIESLDDVPGDDDPAEAWFTDFTLNRTR